jgi:predicted sulfurtransferase
LSICRNLNLLGRIRVADEGINGTLGGREEDIAQYVAHMNENEQISVSPIHWKISDLLETVDYESQKFKTLSVKTTKEVVSLDLKTDEKIELIAGFKQ